MSRTSPRMPTGHSMRTTPTHRKVRTKMDEQLRRILRELRLGGLLAQWAELLATARRGNFSHERLLKHVLEAEYRLKSDNARLLRPQPGPRPRLPEGVRVRFRP